MMGKELHGSRIPRLDGVSRIPRPGNIPAPIKRPPVQSDEPPKAQFLRPNGPVNRTERVLLCPTTKPGAAASQESAVKKLTSGERINNTFSMMSKKSTTALKKLFGAGRSDKSLKQQPLSSQKQPQSAQKAMLIRSSTYIQEGSFLKYVDQNQHPLTQSTPHNDGSSILRCAKKARQDVSQKAQSLDITTLLGNNETRTLPATTKLEEPSEKQLQQRSLTFDNSPLCGNTVCLNSPVTEQITPEIKILGQTVCLEPQLNTTMLVIGQPLNSAQLMQSNSPQDEGMKPVVATACNNTYLKSSSLENLTMLEDISVPSDFDLDLTVQSRSITDRAHNSATLAEHDLDSTLIAQPPDKASLKLPLNSTMNADTSSNGLLLVGVPDMAINFNDFLEMSPSLKATKNTTQLLYMTTNSATTTPDLIAKLDEPSLQSKVSPLKSAQSELMLPTHTPDEDHRGTQANYIDSTAILATMGARTEDFYGRRSQQRQEEVAMSLQDVNATSTKQQKSRFSFGLDLTESTLDCSIDLVDASLSSSMAAQPAASQAEGTQQQQQQQHHQHQQQQQHQQHEQHHQQQQQQQLKKQNSFELDESLGILTPDQMKEFLDSAVTNNTSNTNNLLDLPLNAHATLSQASSNKHGLMRVDQTPSPEELPLDPVGVKTAAELSDMVFALTQQRPCQALSAALHAVPSATHTMPAMQEPISQHTDTELSKTDTLSKSTVSKISTSFITSVTSVTSVTSLDTGYQGDGEMSRPASRGACDHSPSNGPGFRKAGAFGHVSRQPSFQQQGPLLPAVRRQDPMTDSDFFTESDADDIFNRGDRRAQVIDGQLYGPTLQQASASVFISEDPQMEDSCMESSGIFTDAENRCEEDVALIRHQDTQEVIVALTPDQDVAVDADADVEMDPEADHSTETVRSSRENALSTSQTSSTIQSNLSYVVRPGHSATTLSNRTSYCSVDGSCSMNAIDSKSSLSLDEAFALAGEANESATGGSCSSPNECKSKPVAMLSKRLQEPSTPAFAHSRVSSPRKHGSLTSLGSNVAVNCKKSASRSTSSTSSSASAVSVQSNSNASANGKRSTKSSGEHGSTRKYQTPNKWDAVMDKIANNKAVIKKDYSEVKSKVSTRLNMALGKSTPVAAVRHSSSGSAATTPTVRRSSSVASGASNARGVASKSIQSGASTPKDPVVSTPLGKGPQAKRLLQSSSTVKRGRSYSKDSQKSSQSDLSLGGSPKLLATPLRSAKKRDVRNLSISPTDLGPPPKAQQTLNGSTARAKTTVVTLTQRRVHNNGTQQSTSTTPSGAVGSASIAGSTAVSSTTKGSPPPKKAILTSRRQVLPAKDQNHLSATPSVGMAGSKIAVDKAPTELQPLNCDSLHNNNNTIGSTSAVSVPASDSNTPATPIAIDQPVAAITSKPALLKSAGGSPSSTLKASKKSSATTASVSKSEKKPQVKSTRKSLFKKQSSPQQSVLAVPAVPEAPQSCAREEGTVGDYPVVALEHLQLLSGFLNNGSLNFEALERHLQKMEFLQHEKRQQDTSMIALGVLLNYLANDLDAFACPKAKTEVIRTKDDLMKAIMQLEEARVTISELQDKLHQKETFYQRREEELLALNRCELEKAKSNLLDYQVRAKEQVALLEAKLASNELEIRRNFDCYRMEMEVKLEQRDERIHHLQAKKAELEQRVVAIQSAEATLRDLLKTKEDSFNKRIEAATEREQRLEERLKVLAMELDCLRESKKSQERELRDKLNLSQDEISILRTSHTTPTSHMSTRYSTGSPNTSQSELTRLQSETESLRCVLELKQKEISKLTKHNEELMRDANERLALQSKISLLESQNELLQSENELKAEREKQFQRQLDELQKDFNHEAVRRTRLSYDNEALQWQLKQRSEQLHLVESKLQELSTNETLNMTNLSSCNRTQMQNDTCLKKMLDQDEGDGGSPTSPVVKGMITKADSISWVLQMDADSPETAASKMVKRAGSFRSIERNNVTRRQWSLSANAGSGSSNSSTSTIASTSGTGPNPLSQSMSAASVIRQHSNESEPRVRSKSMSVRSSPERMAKVLKSGKKSATLSNGSAKVARKQDINTSLGWKEPITCSSPYIRPRTSTVKMNGDEAIEGINGAAMQGSGAPLFRRSSSSSSSSRTLITCDISSLETGERLDMGALPNAHHPDLKLLKKWQEIQESAGEAMVSGTNSEDEGCSASSDELASSASTASASGTNGSNCSLNQMKSSSHMFEMLLMEKGGSLEGTPMECSWSEDGDADSLPNGV